MRIQIKETVDKIGQSVELAGWVDVRRDHGKLIFIDLRDETGVIQLVFTPKSKDYELASSLRPEWVIKVSGEIKARPDNMLNADIETGKVELPVESLEILNEAKTPPFPLDTDGLDIDEELRLKYRYLDLRRKRLHDNLVLRHKVVLFIRNYLSEKGFLEIETPDLTKGTPEGAREFIVPSRIYPGNFYVLPQSPQQFKQLLMVAGFGKYFQIARCFRDEDQRGDRQPEFTQLDVEMSFIEQEDVLRLGEDLFNAMVEAVLPDKKISKKPWPRITYKEAMEKYGTDKPDLRENKDDPNELAFAWIVDFPMFEKKEDGSMQAAHHPFTMPHPEDIDKLEDGPLNVRSWAYDMVLNGYEISSGSIRIHNRDLQNRIFKALGISDEKIQARFGHMLEAFEYGAPPHGGFAPGIDRLIMVLANEKTIPEVIAFPKTGTARDLMMGAPSDIDEKQLKELKLKVTSEND